MPSIFASITDLINSPPAYLVAGGALATLVWKIFERIENVLTEGTKQEIASWLRVRSIDAALVAESLTNWPNTFTKIFDRVFGTRHLSWKCLLRSLAASSTVTVLLVMLTPLLSRHHEPVPNVAAPMKHDLLVTLMLLALTNLIPDYIALLETRVVLGYMRRKVSATWWFGLMLIDIVLTVYTAEIGATIVAGVAFNVFTGSPFQLSEFVSKLGHVLRSPLTQLRFVSRTGQWFLIYPAFLTSIWLWLYAAAGLLLRAVRQLDISFEWFNRRFDIERKPLQSIGLVAGGLVAFGYWAGVIVNHWI